MRICLVSLEYPPDTARGGIGSQNWNKAHALAALGHEVHVVSAAARPGPGVDTRVIDDIWVHRLRPPDFDTALYDQSTYWHGYTWIVMRELEALHHSAPFDVLDFAEYGAEGFAYQLNRSPWNWAAVAVQLHGPLAMFSERIGWPEPDSDFARVGSFMEGQSIRKADALMACSANIADFTAGRYEVPRESIDVVHCGVDASTFSPGDGDGRTVLFVGNLAENKGIRTALDAVLRLRPQHPDVRLRALGRGDDDLLAWLRARAERAGHPDAFDYAGFASDRSCLPDEYRRAAVFCSPAHHEVGVANVYIEAMACGCPVVASTTGAAREAVADGESGLLVPPADPDATASALERILAGPALRTAMGAAARQRVDEYFAMERYIGRVLGVYERAIEVSDTRRAAAERLAGVEPAPAARSVG